MKPFLAAFALVVCCTVAFAGNVKKSLLGKWRGTAGDGATQVVTTLEFLENGEFRRTVTMGGKEFTPIAEGKWQLTTSATGLTVFVADPNKIIITYKLMEPTKVTDKTEAWLVKINNDVAFNGKETLHLGPLDGSILGTNYYLRAP
jgi:hypothetical protein